MSKKAIFASLACALLWATILPWGFVTLYTVLEIQTAARTANADGATLATLRTIDLAHKLSAGEARVGRFDALGGDRHNALLKLFDTRARLRALAVDTLGDAGVADADGECTADDATLNSCQIGLDMAACTADWRKISACYGKARQVLRTSADDGKLRSIEAMMETARNEGASVNAISLSRQDVQRAVSADAVLRQDALLPVAEAYRQINVWPFRQIFPWPQGVVVALFTALMAAVGALVGAMLAYLRVRRRRTEYDPGEVVRSFAVAPFFGALSGFMVYFVVAAGAAFFVQPGSGSAAEAVNSLSAPALASLGVFAGLAGEHAVAWIQEKALGFFQLDAAAKP